MRNAEIEMEVREELIQERIDTVAKLEADFARRLRLQIDTSEMVANKKLDIMARLTPAPQRFRSRVETPSEGEGEVEEGVEGEGVDRLDELDELDEVDGLDELDEDATPDQSFASALDSSAFSPSPEDGKTSKGKGRMLDPFLVSTPVHFIKKQQNVQVTRNVVDDDEEEEDEEEEEEEEDEDEDVDVESDQEGVFDIDVAAAEIKVSR